MSLLNSIKKNAQKSGGNKAKFIYFREGQKQRVRFLQDMEDGMEITFHDSFEQGINVPCQEHFGRDCPYCDDDSLRTRSQYLWSVWNYETKEVQIFMFPVNNCSPVPSLVSMYETYGTLMDRDYVISTTGKQQNKTFSVVPMDKNKFRNTKAKPYSEKQVLKMLDQAWPADLDEEEDDEPRRRGKKKSGKAKTKREEYDDDDFDEDDDYDEEFDDEDDDAEDEDGQDYEDMDIKELYRECKSRGIKVPQKKSKRFYIKQLEDYDEAQDDWGDDDDEDDWEDDDE